MRLGTGFELESLPYRIVSVDVADPGAARGAVDEIAKTDSGGALVVVRRHGEIVGELILNGCRDADPLAATELLDTAAAGRLQAFEERSRFLVSGRSTTPGRLPSLTVIICTKDRPAGLARCLGSLAVQTDADFSVVVVDNSSSGSSEIEDLCGTFRPSLRLTYVREPVQGLSRARNTGLRTADAEVLAWIDDDEEADETWVACLRRLFREHPDVSVVLGRMVPAGITTSADVLFEEFGGHNKGGSSQQELFTKEALGPRIYYPLPSFGTGGNMAFRSGVAAAVGGFDTLLGAGSSCPAGEDTLFLSEVLDRGYTLLSAPQSVTWHHHRGSEAELAAQLDSYGIGLGAYFVALLGNRPRRLASLARLLPGALSDMFRSDSVRNANHSERLLELREGNRAAILRGAARYVRMRYGRTR